MYKLFVILVLAITTVHGQTTDAPTYGPPTTEPGYETIQANFLAGVNLIANKSYTVWTIQGFTVNVQVIADVKLTFHLVAQVNGLPRGIEQIQFASIGLSLGFQVKASVDGAIKSISVSSPPIPAFLGDRLADGFNNAVVALDKRIDIDTPILSALVAIYDRNTRKVSVQLPVTLPVIIFVQVQGKVQAQFNTPYNIIAGANQTIQFDAETSITFRSNLPNAITVKKFNATAKGTVAVEALRRAGKALGIFLDITLANKTVTHDSIIRLAYTAADLLRAGIQDAKHLKLAYFDEITNNWIYARDTFVNITGQYLECRTPHFSEWGAFDSSSASNGASTITLSFTSIVMMIMTVLAVRQ